MLAGPEAGGSQAMQGIERKVQQLTKVIYHLNSKGEEAGDVGDQAASYENEIEGILRDAGDRVKRFQQAAQLATDEKLIAEKVREVEVKYEVQKKRALQEMEEFKKRAKEAQVRVLLQSLSRSAPRACMHKTHAHLSSLVLSRRVASGASTTRRSRRWRRSSIRQRRSLPPACANSPR